MVKKYRKTQQMNNGKMLAVSLQQLMIAALLSFLIPTAADTPNQSTDKRRP